MALRIRKREKFIAGAIIGIAAIAAVHMLVFQDKIRRYNDRKMSYEAAKSNVATLEKMPPARERDEYRKLTESDARLIWKTVFDMGLVWPAYFMPPLPSPPAPQDANNKEQVEGYKAALAVLENMAKTSEVAAEAVIVTRLERFVKMKQAYEAGEPWPADPKVGGQPLTGKMKMSFMGNGDPAKTKQWNLPLDLPPGLRDEAKLWDEVNRLHERWDVLNLLSPDSADYKKLEEQYDAQVKKMGLNTDIVRQPESGDTSPLGTVSKYLPEFVRLMHARQIWQQRKEGQVIRVGRNEELTLSLLKRMFRVQLTQPAELFHFNAQLYTLERVIPLARKNGIEEIQAVEFSKYRTLVEYQKPSQLPQPTQRRLLEDGSRARDGGKRGGSAAAVSAVRRELPPYEARGMVGLVRLVYVATNESSMRFLYDVAHDTNYYRIYDLVTVSLPPQGEKVLVAVWVENISSLFTVTYPGPGVTDQMTGLPIAVIGEKTSFGNRFYERHIAQAKKAGLDTTVAAEKALKDAGLWEKAPFAPALQLASEVSATGKKEAESKDGGEPEKEKPAVGAPAAEAAPASADVTPASAEAPTAVAPTSATLPGAAPAAGETAPAPVASPETPAATPPVATPAVPVPAGGQ